jgi:hypothetical protein
MKHLLPIIILAANLLLIAPAIQAQDCRNWTLLGYAGHLRVNCQRMDRPFDFEPGVATGIRTVLVCGRIHQQRPWWWNRMGVDQRGRGAVDHRIRGRKFQRTRRQLPSALQLFV